MTKTLEVIKPFFIMETGDRFERTDKGTYISATQSKYSASSDSDEFDSEYNSSFEISESYANALLAEGILKEVGTEKHVNVFEEIDSLRSQYAYEYAHLDDEFANKPACLKIEKETVLSNLITLLDHLNSLKK